jgi:hypothetical protein
MTGELFSMKYLINEYTNSFGSQSRRSIHSVLSEVSLEKFEIGKLVNKISSFTGPTNYVPRVIKQLEPLQREFVVDMFRDLSLRVRTQFDISNSLSVLNSAIRNVFSGEIQKIEKDLEYLESYINDYSFISGEDDLYNYSFIENFDNESNSYINQDSTLTIPDRDGINFDPSMTSKVDPMSGKLKYSSDFEFSLINLSSNNIKSINIETNFPKEYISSDTEVEKVFNNLNSKSWSMNVKSPFIIKESLLDSEKYANFKNNVVVPPGAQVAVDIEFNFPVDISRLRINANGIQSLGVAQIIIESEDLSSSNTTNIFRKHGILYNPVSLQRNYDIDFGQTYNIKSISIIFFQNEYRRTKNSTIQSEINSKIINKVYSEIRKLRKQEHDTLQDYVIKFFLRETEKSFILRNNKIYHYNYTQYYPKSLYKTNFGAIEKISKNKYFSDLDAFNKFKNTSLISNIVFSIISYSLGARLRNHISSTYVESNLRQTQKSIGSFSSSGLMPVGDSNMSENNGHFIEQNFNSISKSDAEEMLNSIETTNLYEYNFSIESIAFFSLIQNRSTNQKKSVFVSKKIFTDGRPVKVKMLAKYFDELNYSDRNTGNDKTSVEFSVSTKETPISESDWLPIVPYGENLVRSELLIPSSTGQCTLRFEPLPESISLFKDGVELNSTYYSLNIKNLLIKEYNPSSIYFVSYSLKYPNSYQEVMLNQSSLATPILITPSFSGSNGEYFVSTQNSNKIRLSYTPYIDQSRFLDAFYSSYIGTVPSSNTSFGNFDSSSYSPVKVVFEDGTPTVNITNYITSNSQIESFYETDSVLFVHYGDSIIFNQEINKPFRVIYQYVPDTFRYRVIMRSLTNTNDNYSIDRLIFKFSSEKRDNMLINLVKYDNLFKNKVN